MNQKENAANNATKKVWGTNPAGWTHAPEKKVGSKDFFEEVLQKRFSYECQWLSEVVQFESYADKKVLEIGCGAGYDAYMFCKNNADYTGIDLVPENIARTQAHLSYYGYQPPILEIDAAQMGFTQKFDFIYSCGVLHHIFDIEKVLKQSRAHLKDDGKILFIVYHKSSIFYWLSTVFTNWILSGKFLKEPLEKTVSRIEHVGSKDLPLVRVYTKNEFTVLLNKAGFKVTDTKIKKLNREDLPQIRGFSRLYIYIPQTFLNKCAGWWGWYLCVEAVKDSKKEQEA